MVLASREATLPSATLTTSSMLSKSSYTAHYYLPRLEYVYLHIINWIFVNLDDTPYLNDIYTKS